MNRRAFTVVALATAALLLPSVLRAEDEQTVKGRIQEVRASAHQFLLTTDEGKLMTLRVDDHSRLERQGREAALDQFPKGMRVTVTYEPRAGENRVVSMAPAPVSVEDLRNEIRNAIEDAMSYTVQHKGNYYDRLERILEQVNDRIDQLKRQTAKAGPEARQELAEQLEHLRRLRDKAEAEAERVKSAAPGAWDEVKSGVRSALEDLRKGFEKAAEHFRDSGK
jgi:hypothetical protein